MISLYECAACVEAACVQRVRNETTFLWGDTDLARERRPLLMRQGRRKGGQLNRRARRRGDDLERQLNMSLVVVHALVLGVPRSRAPAALHVIESGAARTATLSHRASGWTINASGCPAGQRNAAASECLTAVQEAAQLAGVEVLDIGLGVVDHGEGAGVPPGCLYNTSSKAAIFNSNTAAWAGEHQKYHQACIEESEELPRECAARLFLYPSAAFAYGVYDNNVTSINVTDFEETSELIARYAEQLQGEQVEVELPFEQPGPLWIARGGSLQMDELFSTAWRDGEEEAVHRVRSYADGRSVAKVDIQDTPDQFKAGALAHYRLLTHPCRTDSPAEADLFFYAIPRGYKPDGAHCKRQGAELELLKVIS